MTLVAAVQLPGCNLLPFEAPTAAPITTTSASQTGSTSSDFKECTQLFPGHIPRVAWPGQQRALCFDGFAVLYSGESKTPLYSIERLTRAQVAAAKNVERKNHFYPDARLPLTDRAQLADYEGSGYDKGHMAPAGDMPSAAANAQSFSLANMVPQVPQLNQVHWRQIELATRKYAARASDEVFVFTGPVFNQRPGTIGRGKVWVPSHTWKVVYSRSEGRAWAYWMTNTSGSHSLKPISYEEFERLSGIVLLSHETLQ